MSRLTARNENGFAYLVNVKPNEQEVDSPHKNTLKCILDCFERLTQYEEAEEQGRLLVLPCKVGDTVYSIHTLLSSGKKVIAEVRVDLFFIVLSVCEGRFGKTVFLTRPEAEAALKGAEHERD